MRDNTHDDDELNFTNDLSELAKQVNDFMNDERKENDIDGTENDTTKTIVNLPIKEVKEFQNDLCEEDDFLAREYAAAKEEEEKEALLHNEEIKPDFLEEPELEQINDSLAEQISNAITEDSTTQEITQKKKKKIIIISCLAFFAILISIICIILFTKGGQKAVIENVVAPEVYDNLFEYKEVDKPTVTPTTSAEDEKQEVINVLLIGEEQIEGAKNTDVMIIASLNRKKDELSIMSLMRDLYVNIPGYGYNKLNSAYAKGGISLLEQTIADNFDIQIDNYMLVNFDTFETIVDLLGGVSVTLTQNEAEYLNRTNYISNPANRHVVAGPQIMNGNQALGYCRIRYVSTGKENNDFGRTSRHRAVLNAIFKKVKAKSLPDLFSFMNDVFAKVTLTTDLTKTEFSDYLTEFVDLNLDELNQYRIPEDNTYTGAKVNVGSVLIPNDWNETKMTIHKYLYGEDLTSTNSVTPTVVPTDSLGQ